MENEPDIVETGQNNRLISLLFNNQIPMWKYILRTGLISLIPSLFFVMILGFTGILSEDTGPEFKGSAATLFIMMVVIGPSIETLIMAGGLWVISFITKRRVWQAAISALVWAVMHSLMAPAWGLGVIWPFFVFSCSYLNWRRRSWWRAILVTSCVHGFQNFLPSIVAISFL